MKNKIKSLLSPTYGVEATLPVLAGQPGISQATSAADGDFLDLSTHAYVESGDEVMIGNEESGICILGRSLK